VLWVGMLVYVLRTAIAWRADPSAARALIKLYGNAAAWLFVVVVLTGIASALLLVPLHSLLTTGYGRFLILKSALVVVVAALAIAGRAALNRGSGPARVTRVELATLAVILILTGLLTVITPPAKSVFGGSATGRRDDPEAERVTGRVQVDPYVLLGLKPGERRAQGDRVRAGGFQIVDLDVEVRHHLLVTWSGRPDRGDVCLLRLEGEPGSAARRAKRHPVRLVSALRPAEQRLVEPGEHLSVRRSEHRGGDGHSRRSHGFRTRDGGAGTCC
jgi:hypothetical protein